MIKKTYAIHWFNDSEHLITRCKKTDSMWLTGLLKGYDVIINGDNTGEYDMIIPDYNNYVSLTKDSLIKDSI
jgi:hypothetical protein